MAHNLTIGYIGLGNAGYSLASVLSRAGYHLIVRDANSARAEQFTTEHPYAKTAPISDPSVFITVDIIITMLPNGEIVREVLLDPETGIASHLKPNAIVVDTSSSSPFHTRETAVFMRAIEPSLTLIDAPVTQAYAFALAKGDATLMVGCSNPQALDLAMPVLKTMGKHVFFMGELGAGHAMKTLNNYTSAASILGLCDVLVAGQKFGLDPQTMIDGG